MKRNSNRNHQPLSFGRLIGGLFLPIVVVALVVGALVYHPQTPLADVWNPIKPLDPTARITRITPWKLSRAAADPEQCWAALTKSGATFKIQPDQNKSEQCHIQTATRLSTVGNSKLSLIETRCEIALRMAMWERHGLQPAAKEHFNASISRIHHFGSYSCRKIAGTDRMSQHATANAIDISGFDLSNGTKIRLRNDWKGEGSTQKFLRNARQTACTWFGLVLSPDYNAAHHDHFHMDQGRWGRCR